MFVLLSGTQAEPGRTVKQEQEEISRNHVQTFISPSVGARENMLSLAKKGTRKTFSYLPRSRKEFLVNSFSLAPFFNRRDRVCSEASGNPIKKQRGKQLGPFHETR